MKEIENENLPIVKGFLFLFPAVLASGLLLLEVFS
jgi:hypothetical protein